MSSPLHHFSYRRLSVLICLHTYTYTYIYIYTWIHIHIHTHIYVHIHIYIYIFICTYIYIYLYIYRICVSCIEREANVYADVHNTCLTYISAHAWCSTTPVNALRLSTKIHMDSCMCTYENGAAAFLSWKLLRTYLESCANIVQAVVYHLPSCRLRALLAMAHQRRKRWMRLGCTRDNNTIIEPQNDGERLGVTARGYVECNRGAQRTHQHTLEGDQ